MGEFINFENGNKGEPKHPPFSSKEVDEAAHYIVGNLIDTHRQEDPKFLTSVKPLKPRNLAEIADSLH